MYSQITSTIKKITVIAILVAFVIGFGLGYTYKSNKAEIKTAKQEATQETAEKIVKTVVTVADKTGIAQLENNLAVSRMRATALELQIKAYEREKLQTNPSNALDCALPTSLRDQINSNLTRDAK